MKTTMISRSEFIDVVMNMRGCQFATIRYTTTIDAVNKKMQGGKKNPYYGRVNTATESVGIYIGASYENGVNNRISDPETTFEAERLPWGEWYRYKYLILHKGAFYVRYYIAKTTRTNVSVYLDGTKCDEETAKAIKSTFRQREGSARQAEVGIAKEDQMKPCTAAVANIVSVTMDGTIYILTD